MWLITPFGFFSVVEKPGDRKSARLTVRARVRGDLVALKETYLPTLGRIMQSTATDYRFRATAPKVAVAEAMRQAVEAIAYSNFKDEVARRQGRAREHLYHDVWAVLTRLQRDPEERLS